MPATHSSMPASSGDRAIQRTVRPGPATIQRAGDGSSGPTSEGLNSEAPVSQATINAEMIDDIVDALVDRVQRELERRGARFRNEVF